jgi:hypothetical protein
MKKKLGKFVSCPILNEARGLHLFCLLAYSLVLLDRRLSMLQEERRNKTALYNPMTIAEVGCLNNDDIL